MLGKGKLFISVSFSSWKCSITFKVHPLLKFLIAEVVKKFADENLLSLERAFFLLLYKSYEIECSEIC